MCIAVHAAGHLVIDLMLESLHPVRSTQGGVDRSDQSFDLVVKNFSDRPIDRLVVIHPRQLYADLAAPHSDSHESIPCWAGLRWFGERLHSKDRLELSENWIRFDIRADDLRSPSVAEKYVEHMARLVDPVAVRPHPLIRSDAAVRRFVAAQPALPSILEVELSEPLQPYRERAPETVYYIRLNLKGVPVKPISAYKMPLNGAGLSNRGSYLLKQVFALMAPQLVWSRLETRLQYERAMGSEEEQAAAARLLAEVVDGGFRSPGSTVRIRDHRIGIVVPEDSHFDAREFGKLLPWQTKRLAADDTGSTDEARALVWLAGPEAFPEADAESLARRLCYHLIDAARPGRPAARISDTGVAVACGCQSLDNARFILAVLAMLGELSEANSGTQWELRAQPPERQEDLAGWREAQCARVRSREWQLELRQALARARQGYSEEEGHAHLRRVFDDQPFVLHFSVVGEAQDSGGVASTPHNDVKGA